MPEDELKQKKILFVAGGVGTAPVYPQVKWLKEHGVDADVIVRFQDQKEPSYYGRDMMKEVAGGYIYTTE